MKGPPCAWPALHSSPSLHAELREGPWDRGSALCELEMGTCHLSPHRLNPEPLQLPTPNTPEGNSGWRPGVRTLCSGETGRTGPQSVGDFQEKLLASPRI